MSPAPAPEKLRLALDLADPALADRIAALLAGVEGIELVGRESELADAVLTDGGRERSRVETGIEPGIEPSDAALTPREREVLALIAEGASNKLIARRLGISAHTAKFHVSAVLDKLDAVSRADAVAHALRRGVIEL